MVSSPTFCHGDGVFGIVGLITSIWINIFLIIWIIGWIIWINNTIFIIYYNINNINMDDIFSYYLILLVSSISLSPLDSKSKFPHEIPWNPPSADAWRWPLRGSRRRWGQARNRRCRWTEELMPHVESYQWLENVGKLRGNPNICHHFPWFSSNYVLLDEKWWKHMPSNVRKIRLVWTFRGKLPNSSGLLSLLQYPNFQT